MDGEKFNVVCCPVCGTFFCIHYLGSMPSKDDVRRLVGEAAEHFRRHSRVEVEEFLVRKVFEQLENLFGKL
ncbi:MAG: hypothetical protein ACPL07_02110 [Candidatus Bathyarchaeia archaeon]